MPMRIQLRRVKDWRKPEGAVVVTRPGAFGNPFTVAKAVEVGYTGDLRALCVQAFREWLAGKPCSWWMGPESDAARAKLLARLPELRGRDLCCFCPLDAPCHADVLLDVANR